MTTPPRIFDLGDVALQSGETLRDAKLAYQTYGELNAARDNVIVLPTFFTGTHWRVEGFIGPGRAMDPANHFIVIVNQFGNSVSSSPSNTPAPQDGPRFPHVSLWDNIACQHRLMTEGLGIDRIALVAGWSLAAMQSFQWGAQYPDMVEAIAPVCGSAKASPHNIVFLEGIKAALCADAAWNAGDYDAPPVTGLRAFARVYAGWAYSQTFYREKLHQSLGLETYEDLLVDWEHDHVDNWDANDLLAKIWTWKHGDISDNPLYGGDFAKAAGAIKARCIAMPCTNDLYFTPKDNEIAVGLMPNAECRTYDSPWGHCVASPGVYPEFERFMDDAIAELLNAQ